MNSYAEVAQNLDREKFTNEEFLFYVRITLLLKKGLEDYKGLQNYYELLAIALATKESFLKIEEIEFRYRGTKQQEFYQYVYSLLNESYTPTEFNGAVQEKLLEVNEQLFTIEGQEALNAYQKSLLTISDYNLGLRLLALFKKYEYGNFTLLRKLGEFIEKLIKQDLRSLNNFMLVVKTNYNVFERLGKIIELPENKSVPTTYAQMLQYLALQSKHMLSYSQFQELVAILLKWQIPYAENQAILETYNHKEYKYPKSFGKPKPGIGIYGKYSNYLE